MKKSTLARLLASVFLLGALSFPSIGNAQAPDCNDGRFHWVPVPGTECLDGSETGFEYFCRPGANPRPLLIYVDGGGACWDGDMCYCPNHDCTNAWITHDRFGQADSDDGMTPAQTQRFQQAAFKGSLSPFDQGWNIVRIPYCTGDAHMGNSLQTYKTYKVTVKGARLKYRAHHRGYRNITLDLAKINSFFPRPSKVAIWGESAGGIGADCNLKQFHDAWMSAVPVPEMLELNNAGLPFGAVYTPKMSTVARTWGAWAPAPPGEAGARIVGKTCPIAPVGANPNAPPPPLRAPWSLSMVVSYNRRLFSDVRKALTDDYGDHTMAQFACLLGATPGANGICVPDEQGARAVARTLKDVFNTSISGATNYKVYYHQGTCHTEREESRGNICGVDASGQPMPCPPDCNFEDMIQDGVFFHDWVNAWINNLRNWDNVIPLEPPPPDRRP